MPQNVEIKARLKDSGQFYKLAESLSDTRAEILLQEDVFFNVTKGRLKLRIFHAEAGDLIYYERPDTEGPKTSSYSISKTSDPAQLREVLSQALGVLGIVKKKRTLFLTGQTRIHFDEVEELGYFMELEVVLKEGQTSSSGEKIARDLMTKLNIEETDLIDRAYIDLMD